MPKVRGFEYPLRVSLLSDMPLSEICLLKVYRVDLSQVRVEDYQKQVRG